MYLETAKWSFKEVDVEQLVICIQHYFSTKLCGKHSDIILLQLKLKFTSGPSHNICNRLLDNIWAIINIRAVTVRCIQYGQCTTGAGGNTFKIDGKGNRFGGVVDGGLEGVVAGRRDANNVECGTESGGIG